MMIKANKKLTIISLIYGITTFFILVNTDSPDPITKLDPLIPGFRARGMDSWESIRDYYPMKERPGFCIYESQLGYSSVDCYHKLKNNSPGEKDYYPIEERTNELMNFCIYDSHRGYSYDYDSSPYSPVNCSENNFIYNYCVWRRGREGVIIEKSIECRQTRYLKTLNKGIDSTDFDKWTRFAGDQFPTEKEKLVKNTRGLFWFSVNISLIYSFLSYLFRIAF